MFCTKCGHPNSEGQKFCRNCGTNFLLDESGNQQSGQLSETTNLKTGEIGSSSAGSPPIPVERATRKLDAISSELDSATRPIAPADYHPKEGVRNTIETEPGNPATSSPLDTHSPTTGSAPVISSNRSHRGLGISLALAVVLLGAATSFYYFKVAGSSSPDNEVSEIADSANTNQSQAATTEEPQTPIDAIPSDALGLTPDAPPRTGEGAKGDKGTGGNGKPESDISKPPSQGGSDPTTAKPAAVPPATSEPPPAPAPTAEEYKQQGLKSLGAKQYGQAITAFRAGLRLQPSNGDFHYLIALAYEGQGLLAEALNSYKRCQSGTYVPQAAQHVKRLTKKLEKK